MKKKDAFRNVGATGHYELNVEENFAQIPAFWAKTVQNSAFFRVLGLLNQEPKGILGISSCMNGKDFNYYIAAASDMDVPEGLEEYTVPACTWTIFICIDPMPSAIQNLQKRIVTEWLPDSG